MEPEKETQEGQIFTWRHSGPVEEVCLVGDFNHWNPMSMSAIGDEFRISLPLAPGRYEYKFLVNGQWRNDSDAVEFVTNEFGSTNSVLHVI
jgi:1,4-alpha-glucan branching enzyme